MSDFQKNIELWAKIAPKEAVMLPYVDCSSLTFCQTKQDELNLKKDANGKTHYLHSNQGALKEAQEWFKSLSLENSPVIYVYGIGLGYYFEAAKEWLNKDSRRRLIFLEDDLAVIYKFFESDKAHTLLQNPQVQLIFFRTFKEEETAFDHLYWNFVMTKLTVSALKSYEKEKKELYLELQHKIAYDAAVRNALVDEYLRYGGAFFVNFYQNMLSFADSYLGNQFFGKFQNVPAIICGAGPSLEKNIQLVGSLLNRAVVFAGGSALNALNAHSLQPHFGAGIDPNKEQLVRMKTNQGYEVPFFYRNRMLHDAFKLIHGPRLYITGSGGYDIAEYFEQKFKINTGFIDEGHNVVNFCVEIANAMGCNPIIFVGMDLAFTKMKAYASGIVKETKISKTELLDTEDYDSKALLRKDIFGKPTYTLWKWIAESEWISSFAKKHPLLTMINCTEGGLGFRDIDNRPLAEVAEQWLKREYELKNRIHGETQNSLMPQVTHAKVVKAMKQLYESLKQSHSHLEILIEETEKTAKKIKAGEISAEATQSGRAALAETELAEEFGYKHAIEIFNIVQSRILTKDLHEINTSKLSEKKKILARLNLNVQRLKFLGNVAQVNYELIGYALREDKKNTPPSAPPTKPSTQGKYLIKNKKILINDPELNLRIESPFDPIKIPKNPQNGQELPNESILRVFFNDEWKINECFVEKNGRPHGQCLLYYPNGSIKEETFYLNGKLHGPSTFWNPKGQILAKAWFINGKQEGKMHWYFPSGSIYSLQRFKKGLWNGQQEYYHENGQLKTLLHYELGQLVSFSLY